MNGVEVGLELLVIDFGEFGGGVVDVENDVIQSLRQGRQSTKRQCTKYKEYDGNCTFHGAKVQKIIEN